MGAAVTRRLALLRFQLTRLGWPAWLGAGLMVAGLGLDLALTRPMEVALDAAIEHNQRAILAPRPIRPAPAGPLSALRLGARDMAALESVFASAQAAGIELDQGDYTLDTDGRRLRIQLPLHADYPALRLFLAGCLNEVPALMLDSVKLERPDNSVAELDARVQFILQLSTSP